MNDDSATSTGARRPPAATVLGVVGIVLGVLGVLGSIWGIFGDLFHGPGGNPLAQIRRDNSGREIWPEALNVLGFVSSVLFVIAGFGLLRIRRWARMTMVGLGVYLLVTTPVVIAVMWIYELRPTRDVIESQPGPSDLSDYYIAAILGLFIATLLNMVHGAAIVYFLRRPALVAVFEGREAPPGPPEPTTSRDELIATIVPYRNKHALLSYYLGVLSVGAVVPLLGIAGVAMGIAAVILGWKGLDYEHFHPEAKGRNHARVGIACGLIFAGLGVLVHAWLIVLLMRSR